VPGLQGQTPASRAGVVRLEEEVMNVAAPAAAAENVEGLFAKVRAFLDVATVEAADGLTWAEFGSLFLSLMRLVMTVVDSVSGLTGPQKKQLVLDALALLFDTLADRAVPAVAWPVWIVARPAIRSLLLALASGAIENILPLVRSA
jgi:hypothetical protein